jgi:hypothetical protein
VLNGATNDTTLSNAFPCNGGVIEGCALQASSGKTSFVYNGGASGISIKNCVTNNSDTTPLYAEQYDQQYKGVAVSIENCGTYRNPIIVQNAVAATNNEAAALIDLVGPANLSFGKLTYSEQNLAQQDFNQWTLLASGSATIWRRRVSTTTALFGDKPVWEVRSTASGTSDIFGFTLGAAVLSNEFTGKLFWFGAWVYATNSNCFPVLFTNQQSFNVNPPTTGSWQFRAVSFTWPASGTLEFGVYKSGSLDGTVYIAAPMLAPVGVNLQRAMATIRPTRTWLGTAAPTGGTWAMGDRVFNQTPVVGQPKSWVCTVGGTPGTWVSEGNL